MMYIDQYGDEWISEDVYHVFCSRRLPKEKKKRTKKLEGRHIIGRHRGANVMCRNCKSRKSTTTTHLGTHVCQNCFLDHIDNWGKNKQ